MVSKKQVNFKFESLKDHPTMLCQIIGLAFTDLPLMPQTDTQTNKM